MTRNPLSFLLFATGVVILLANVRDTPAEDSARDRVRILIETDAGSDPDDEQSLVRFLLYTNEFDVVGIICNRQEAIPGENLNPKRTGLEIVQRQITAYAECHANLVKHDRRYPSPDMLRKVTVSGYEDSSDGAELVIKAVDADDPRPIWFCNWGTGNAASSSLKRALDKVLQERGPEGYARFKQRLRLSSDNQFGDHITREPAFPIWVDTFRPEMERKRWYHRFSAMTATAGGFDLRRDVLTGHGPLGAMYPTNTTHPQKEGDTMSFLYLVPTGMNDPEQPTWGSWAGRYGLNPTFPSKPYYWANATDTWQGSTHRENTLKRWAADLQNDFRVRMDWCVEPFEKANHPPTVVLNGDRSPRVLTLNAPPGLVTLSAAGSSDPDGQPLTYHWSGYSEPGSYRGELNWTDADSNVARLSLPADAVGTTIHALLTVTDNGSPPLTRYRRVVIACQAK
jgi:hypothetical protein